MVAVKNPITEVFSCEPPEVWHLYPDDIHKIAELSGVRLTWKKIDWWDLFTSDVSIIHDEKFIELFLPRIDNNDTVLLVTDEGLSDQIGYSFKFKDFPVSTDDYEDRFKMEFFQDSDYSLLSRNGAKCRY